MKSQVVISTDNSLGQLKKMKPQADASTLRHFNLELFLAGEGDEVAGESRDRRPDDEWRSHHAPARIFLRRGSEMRHVARGVCWRRRLLNAGVPLCPAERSGGQC